MKNLKVKTGKRFFQKNPTFFPALLISLSPLPERATFQVLHVPGRARGWWRQRPGSGQLATLPAGWWWVYSLCEAHGDRCYWLLNYHLTCARDLLTPLDRALHNRTLSYAGDTSAIIRTMTGQIRYDTIRYDTKCFLRSTRPTDPEFFPHTYHHHHYSACTISVRSSACYQ